MTTLWIILTVVFALAELLTPGALVSVWFAVGAGAALAASLFGISELWQFLIFLAISIGFLFQLRPMAEKLQDKDPEKLNADRFIGMTGVVKTAVNNTAGTGSVLISGTTWTARSDGGEDISSGSKVTVLRIEGNKLIVKTAGEPGPAV